MFADTEELRMLADTVRRAAREKIAPLAASIDEKGEFNREVAALFWDLGLMTLTFPPRLGGMERDRGTALSLAVEEIARHCASSSLLLIIQAVGSFPILHGGSAGLKKKFLTRLGGNSRLLTALGATEPSAGSDLLGMKSRAVRKGDHYVINGQKCFITNGSVADMIVVYAYTDPGRKAKGISAFVVEKGTASPTSWRPFR